MLASLARSFTSNCPDGTEEWMNSGAQLSGETHNCELVKHAMNSWTAPKPVLKSVLVFFIAYGLSRRLLAYVIFD